jgi:glutaredoxin 3
MCDSGVKEDNIEPINFNVEIHTKPKCVYCIRAIELIKSYNIPYYEIIYDPAEGISYENRKYRLQKITNHRTFPQIFMGGNFIGGYNELRVLFEKISKKSE